jgi:DNA invertase Pin-like site-specific DNA recombinase
MNAYEKEQLEKIAKKLVEQEHKFASWITAIKNVQDEFGIMRQQIYNALNHEKISEQQD